jgi:hypothetical protein
MLCGLCLVASELLRYGHMSTAGDIYSFGIMSEYSRSTPWLFSHDMAHGTLSADAQAALAGCWRQPV